MVGARRVLLHTAKFSPLALANLDLWLDASAAGTLYQDSALTTPASADGDPVGGWLDLSGNGRNATQTTAAARPTLQVAERANRNVVRFDGVDDAFAIASAAWGPSYTVLCVLIATNITAGSGRVVAMGTSNPVRAHIDGTNNVGWETGGGLTNVAPMTFGAWQRLIWLLPDAGTGEIYRNGASIGTAAFSSGGGASGASSISPAGDQIQADVAELIVYRRALSASEWGQLDTYLRGKWGF